MGVYLSQPNKQKHTASGKGLGLSFFSAEMQGWRKNMQDAVIHQCDIGNGNSLFAVFDGHGGFQISQFAKQAFKQQLTRLQSYQQKNYPLALEEAFREVDKLVLSAQGQKALKVIRNSPSEAAGEGREQFIGNTVGCTANVVLITPQSYIVANAGDSRSSLCRDGVAIDLSLDHKPQSKIEEDRIKKAGGMITMGRVNGGLNLTRSLADFDYKKNTSFDYKEQMITCHPDVKVFERSKSDQFILIGCDGIWQKYVENSQGLIDRVKQGLINKKETQALVRDLLDELIAVDTNSGIGCDNMSTILILLNQ